MSVCCECCVLSGRGLCEELITRPEESYWLWCVVVCDLEKQTSRMRRPRPTRGLLHQKKGGGGSTAHRAPLIEWNSNQCLLTKHLCSEGKVWEEGRYHIFPICDKARHSAATVRRSIRLPTAEVDKFTKQPTYNIHKSINNKGTRQQYKHTESELPRSWCQDSTSPESRDCAFERSSRWRHFH
jgi:hypothetical protein